MKFLKKKRHKQKIPGTFVPGIPFQKGFLLIISIILAFRFF